MYVRSYNYSPSRSLFSRKWNNQTYIRRKHCAHLQPVWEKVSMKRRCSRHIRMHDHKGPFKCSGKKFSQTLPLYISQSVDVPRDATRVRDLDYYNARDSISPL